MVTHTNRDAHVSLNRRVRVVAKTANYVVTEGESGTHFTNVGAGNIVVFTLPALKAGLEFWFHACIVAQDVKVSPPGANTMVVFNDIASTQAAFNQSAEIAGGVFHVICDGTLWYCGAESHDAQTHNIE